APRRQRIAELQRELREALFGVRIARCEAEGVLQVAARPRAEALLAREVGGAAPAGEVVWLDPERLFEVHEGVVEPPLPEEQLCELVARAGVVRATPHCLLQRALGERRAAVRDEDAREQAARVAVIRAEGEGLLELLNNNIILLFK